MPTLYLAYCTRRTGHLVQYILALNSFVKCLSSKKCWLATYCVVEICLLLLEDEKTVSCYFYLCFFVSLLLCCFVALLLCCFVTLLLCYFVVLLLCCFVALLLCLLCCFVVLLFCCFVALFLSSFFLKCKYIISYAKITLWCHKSRPRQDA